MIRFLIHTDRNYLFYAKRCVASLREHSRYEPIVYGYGEDFSEDKELKDVLVRQTPLHSDVSSAINSCNSRLQSCVNALEEWPDDTFVYIDADMFAIRNIDNFIEQNVSRIDAYPLFLIYLHDNLIHWNIDENGTETSKGHGDEAAEYLGITPRGPHAEGGDGFIDFTLAGGLFMFDGRSKVFLEEVLRICSETKRFRESDEEESRLFWDERAFSNERIINALFWKYGFQQHLPLTWVSAKYDNSFLPPFLQSYSAQGFDIVYSCEDRSVREIGFDQALFLHGQALEPEVDVCGRLKREESLSLLAQMEMVPVGPSAEAVPHTVLVPTVSYDRFRLFAPPFFTTTSWDGHWSLDFLPEENNPNFTINFPFLENTADRGIDEMLFIFLIDGMVIDACNFGLPHSGMLDEQEENARSLFLNGKKWWVWGHPVSMGCKPVPYGWASTLQGALEKFSVQIYG